MELSGVEREERSKRDVINAARNGKIVGTWLAASNGNGNCRTGFGNGDGILKSENLKN